jgi:hypothetical protein
VNFVGAADDDESDRFREVDDDEADDDCFEVDDVEDVVDAAVVDAAVLDPPPPSQPLTATTIAAIPTIMAVIQRGRRGEICDLTSSVSNTAAT